jgi:hypothetical protein
LIFMTAAHAERTTDFQHELQLREIEVQRIAA